MASVRIFFVRHGESEANVKRVFAGQKNDSPLTKVGRKQAKETAREIKLMKVKVNKIISSPLLRALETAEIIRQECGLQHLEIIKDERIAEYDMGDVTGKPFFKMNSLKMTSAKNAEDPVVFNDRIHNLLAEVKKEIGHILLVSHAGVGRAIVGKKKGIEPKNFYDIEPLKNAEVMEIS